MKQFDLTREEIKLLLFFRDMYGNRAKAKIQRAWETGDYSPLRLSESGEATLQFLRNKIGPSGLWGLRWPMLEGAGTA